MARPGRHGCLEEKKWGKEKSHALRLLLRSHRTERERECASAGVFLPVALCFFYMSLSKLFVCSIVCVGPSYVPKADSLAPNILTLGMFLKLVSCPS